MPQRLMNAKRINRIVAGNARDDVADVALGIGVRAEGNLARHRRAGTHRIEVTQGRVDSFVSLLGPGAASVELGHFTGYRNREWVPGLRILRDAAGV